MYSKEELRRRLENDDINDDDEGFMHGYLDAFKKKRNF